MTEERTYKERVADFWDWFSENAEAFKHQIDEGHCGELVDATSEKVSALAPHLAWVYGPGLGEGRHSLTVTAEGIRHQQFLTRYWAESAPEINDWDFFPARQPSPNIGDWGINIGDHSYSIDKMWLVPEVDEENQVVHIRVWHPEFSAVPDSVRHQVLFLLLDEVLGEWGTESWLGRIEVAPADDEDVIPLIDLRDLVAQLEKKHGWEKHPPDDSYSFYEPGDNFSGFPRADCWVGTTSDMPLIGEYLETGGKMENPLKGSGADFVYLKMPSAVLPEGREIDARTMIEDRINRALSEHCDGRSFGTAMSASHAYLDFIIFNGQGSIDIMMNEMRRLELPPETSIEYFIPERGQESHTLGTGDLNR